jgi:glycosyltransferase involved in cell wall biosynthesis
MKICILLNFVRGEWGMLARPEIAEIYGEHFATFGHKSTLILWSRARRVQHNWHAETRVFAVPMPQHRCFPIRLSQYIVAAYRKVKILSQLIDTGACDLILVEDDILSALVALYIRALRGIPIVLHDASPDAEIMMEKSDLGLNQSPALYRFLGKLMLKLDRFVMRKADLVIAQSEYLRQSLLSDKLEDKDIVVVPNGAAVEKFAPTVAGERIRQEYSLTGCQVVVYAGTMSKLRRLDVLLHAFARVKEIVPEARLLMIGEGDDVENLSSLAAQLGIANHVVFVGSVPYSDMPEYLAAGDVAVSPIPPKYIYKVSSPLKLFEYMATGKPVVANSEIPEQRDALSKSKGGVLVSFNSEAFAAGLIELLQSPDKAQAMGQAGREWVVKHRSYEVLARHLEVMYLELMSTKAGRDTE